MTREEIIDGLKFTIDMFLFDPNTGKSVEPRNDMDKITIDACKGAIELLEQMRWIPCSERLPEENKDVLMCLEWGIDIGEYRDGGWHSEWINHYDDDSVIAWMSLPKPYKGGDGERVDTTGESL